MKAKKQYILIADASLSLLKDIQKDKEAKKYNIETATNGKECLKKIEQFLPELVIIDLMLPGMHGIEILKQIKEAPLFQKMGVIIMSAQPMIQNYRAALKMGAAYFLEKPFINKKLFSIIDKYFQGKLQPDPFSGPLSSTSKGKSHHEVSITHQSYIKFWGTRGSNPVSGAEYVRFGGNTCCLEVKHKDDLLIIDSGTGIRSLGKNLNTNQTKKIHLFLSHTHWDHLMGFPFFSPIYKSNCELCIWAPVGFEKSTKELFTEMLAYAYFPVRLDDIQSKIIFKDLRDGETIQIGKIKVSTHYAFHPGPTLCFKINLNGKTFAYVTDNEFLMGHHDCPKLMNKKSPLLTPYKRLLKFLEGCDTLIHEAQYTPLEYQVKVGWGHSSVTNASLIPKLCGIKEWIVTHHDPKHTDEDMLKKHQIHLDVMKEIKYSCRVRLAYDGLLLPF